MNCHHAARLPANKEVYSHRKRELTQLTYLWDLLLLSFKAVALMALLPCPVCISSITCEVECTGHIVASGTAIPLGWMVFWIPIVCKLRKMGIFQSAKKQLIEFLQARLWQYNLMNTPNTYFLIILPEESRMHETMGTLLELGKTHTQTTMRD